MVKNQWESIPVAECTVGMEEAETTQHCHSGRTGVRVNREEEKREKNWGGATTIKIYISRR